MFSMQLAGCGNKRLPFRQYHPVRTMKQGGRAEGHPEVSEPMRAGVSLHVWVYADDKQGCTNVSGNSTSRNGWFMSEVSWKELVHVMSTFLIVGKNFFSFKSFPASERRVRFTFTYTNWRLKCYLKIFRRLIFLGSNKMRKKNWNLTMRKIENGPLISIAINIL